MVLKTRVKTSRLQSCSSSHFKAKLGWLVVLPVVVRLHAALIWAGSCYDQANQHTTRTPRTERVADVKAQQARQYHKSSDSYALRLLHTSIDLQPTLSHTDLLYAQQTATHATLIYTNIKHIHTHIYI